MLLCYSPPVSKHVHSSIVGAVTDKEDSSESDLEEEQLPSLSAYLRIYIWEVL